MTIVAVGVLLASSFATFGQWRWLIGVYPTVADTELDRLGHWLALVQVDEQPSEVRRSLVERFQRELAGGWSPLKSEDATGSVDLEAYRDQIASNIELLTRDWFYYRCEQYVEVNEASARLAFVAPQVEAVLFWADVYSQVHNHGKDASEQNAFELFDKFDLWV